MNARIWFAAAWMLGGCVETKQKQVEAGASDDGSAGGGHGGGSGQGGAQAGQGGGGGQGGATGGQGGGGRDGASSAPDAPGGDAQMDPTCQAGFHACPGLGCVSNMAPASCGMSCRPCEPPMGGSATCNGMTCGTSCPSQTTLCAGKCIAVGTPCNGMCPSGKHDCSGNCVADDDTNACGPMCRACMAPANSQPVCVNGNCDFNCTSGRKCGNACIPDAQACNGACPSGRTACGTSCITSGMCCTNNTPGCGANQTCNNGTCTNNCVPNVKCGTNNACTESHIVCPSGNCVSSDVNEGGMCSPQTCSGGNLVVGHCRSGSCRTETAMTCMYGCTSSGCNACKPGTLKCGPSDDKYGTPKTCPGALRCNFAANVCYICEDDLCKDTSVLRKCMDDTDTHRIVEVNCAAGAALGVCEMIPFVAGQCCGGHGQNCCQNPANSPCFFGSCGPNFTCP
jgi:hypothetical protein